MNSVNAEIVEAWNTVLFDKFVRFRHLLTAGLAIHGEEALGRHAPPKEGRVLDIGCGFGDTTQEIARMVGPAGEAVGVDCAANFIEAARAEAAAAGLSNARFLSADVAVDELRGPYDALFSRFGTMFFNFPGAAMRNLRSALKPGGELTMVVWRRREDNPWLHEAELCVRELVPVVEDSDRPTCGPGPFSMSGPDMVSSLLISAGFGDISFERFDAPICIGRNVPEAIDFAIQLGPAGEIIRLAGEEGERRLDDVTAALATRLRGFRCDTGVYAPSSTWIVHARAD